ncbi:Uncharacterised protein [Yersinia enterocolitica]|nr:Uncharacterised protein [Yersinia enterocolitica]
MFIHLARLPRRNYCLVTVMQGIYAPYSAATLIPMLGLSEK